jgi:hypothetical protein
MLHHQVIKKKTLRKSKTRRNKEERLQEQKKKNSTLCRNGVTPFLGKQNKMAPNIKHKNKNWYYMTRHQRQQPLSHNSNTPPQWLQSVVILDTKPLNTPTVVKYFVKMSAMLSLDKTHLRMTGWSMSS